MMLCFSIFHFFVVILDIQIYSGSLVPLMRQFYTLLAAFLFAFTVSAAAKTSAPDSLQAGSQYFAYPVPERGIPELTPAPKGYVPFHIEHYGRHGSRWLTSLSQYEVPVKQLEIGEKYGKLTPRGQEVLDQLRVILENSRTRIGELSPLGHRQHRGIANRMYHNFPSVFAPGTHVDAKSTKVIRCILSMANEVAEFQALNPELVITMDASTTTQPILNNSDLDQGSFKAARKASHLRQAVDTLPFDKTPFFDNLFTDRDFVATNIDSNALFNNLFDVTVNAQSHDDHPSFYDLFTPDLISRKWLADNASWFISVGNSAASDGRVPFNQRFLLDEIIKSADTAMVSPRLSANLRFGHETVLIPLTVFLELGHYGDEINDLNNLPDRWRNYEIFPMGSNIQLIFYRPKVDKVCDPDKILVKALLNEREVSLPVSPVDGVYYRWSDLRDYYQKKLDSFEIRFKE